MQTMGIAKVRSSLRNVWWTLPALEDAQKVRCSTPGVRQRLTRCRKQRSQCLSREREPASARQTTTRPCRGRRHIISRNSAARSRRIIPDRACQPKPHTPNRTRPYWRCPSSLGWRTPSLIGRIGSESLETTLLRSDNQPARTLGARQLAPTRRTKAWNSRSVGHQTKLRRRTG